MRSTVRTLLVLTLLAMLAAPGVARADTLLPLTLAVSADTPSAAQSATDGYTVTVANPNDVDVNLLELDVHLPDHGHGAVATAGATPDLGAHPFAYLPGTTTGFTTDDPVVTDQIELAWQGSWPVPAGGSLSLHYGVRVSAMVATYYTTVRGVADTTTVLEARHVAPIVVVNEGPVQIAVTPDATRACAQTSDGYTITVTNSAATDFTFAALRVGLPAGFSYLPGSTTGLTTADPAISKRGIILRFTGPFTVPAAGAVSLHLGVDVGGDLGSRLVRVRVVPGDGAPTIGTGPVAPIHVRAC